MKSTALIFIVLSTFIADVSCSHYRGSMVTWRVLNATSNPLIVEVLQRHAWNYSWYPCTAPLIAAGNYLIGSGNLVCSGACPPSVVNIATVAVPCIGYNQIEKYTSGEGRSTFSVPQNYRFRAVFTGSGWFSLVTGGGTWSLATEISTYLRSNGRYNQAPIVTMLPIIRLRRLLTYDIKINVADNDFDRYTCTWSNSTQECGGICRSSLSLPASTSLNTTSCVLHFIPNNVGFYAMAFTILDFEDDTSTTPLSRVPIQFIFNVWDSNVNCSLSPIYIGDAPADQCIFVEPGQTISVLVRIKVRCPNATLANIINVSPSGFTQSATYSDPYDPTVNNFRISYLAGANQIGQNLFCFAGVDSIGNQGDTTCLRFTVQSPLESRNTLYISNVTRFPTGLVSKYQSTWTLLYPANITYTRPTVDASVRFKSASTQADFVTYNVAKQTANVDYRPDRLVIISSVVFNPGQKYYIFLDPGVFIPIATCLRDSMGITDAGFWTFETASEPNTTFTTSTTTQPMTTTLLNRTVPTLRTIPTTAAETTRETRTTTELITATQPSTTIKEIKEVAPFPIGGIVGILLGSFTLIALIGFVAVQLRKRALAKLSTPDPTTFPKKKSFSETLHQYLVTTRTNLQAKRRSTAYIARIPSPAQIEMRQNLVSIEC